MDQCVPASQCAGIRGTERDYENLFAAQQAGQYYPIGFLDRGKSWLDLPGYNFDPGTPMGLGFLFSDRSLAANGIAGRWFDYTVAQNQYQQAGLNAGAVTFDALLTRGAVGASSGISRFQAGGSTFAERLFNSSAFGKDSLLFGNKHFSSSLTPGLLNKPGGRVKIGWSSTSTEMGMITPTNIKIFNDGGQQFRITFGRLGNQGFRHLYVPRTFVPNSVANPLAFP